METSPSAAPPPEGSAPCRCTTTMPARLRISSPRRHLPAIKSVNVSVPGPKRVFNCKCVCMCVYVCACVGESVGLVLWTEGEAEADAGMSSLQVLQNINGPHPRLPSAPHTTGVIMKDHQLVITPTRVRHVCGVCSVRVVCVRYRRRGVGGHGGFAHHLFCLLHSDLCVCMYVCVFVCVCVCMCLCVYVCVWSAGTIPLHAFHLK